jgi:excisionase family DNA binding protein
MHRLTNPIRNSFAPAIALDPPREPAPAEDLVRGQVAPSYLMTTAELAEALRVSERSVKRMAAMRSLPGVVKLGRSLRFGRKAIESWIAQGCPPVRNRR